MRGGLQLLRLFDREPEEPHGDATETDVAGEGELFIDGGLVGKTPATLRLAPGKHMVRVSSGAANDSPEIMIMSPVALNLEATPDSIRLGLKEPQVEPVQIDWPHKRLLPRYVGPLPANLYYGLSDFAEEVQVRDFSEHGLYFWSSQCMPIGGSVDIRMELPFEISSNRGRSVRYRATVLRVEEAAKGMFGTAALIKSCTPSYSRS